jgi:hypothetical protein
MDFSTDLRTVSSSPDEAPIKSAALYGSGKHPFGPHNHGFRIVIVSMKVVGFTGGL